jgi:hypothetical protein
MRNIVVLFFVLIACFSFANDYKKEIRKEIEKQFGSASDEKTIMFDYNHFVILNKDTFIVPNGYHYVYKLEKGKPIRQDQSTFHGGNFGRFLFTWKGKIYALGGYGFYTTNNHLEYFNQSLKGWGVENMVGDVPPFIHGINYELGNKIISFNNYKAGNSIKNNKLDSNLYFFDLHKKKWTKKQLNIKACFIGQVHHFKDYVLSIGNVYSVLINKQKLEFVLIKNDEFGLNIEHNQVNDIIGNKLEVITTDNHKKTPMRIWLDLNVLWSKLPKQVLITNTKNTTSLSSFWYILVISGFFLLISVYFYKKGKGIHKEIEYNDIEQKLINENRILNTDELDELLGIEHMDADSKKFKRNRMINEMNQRHPEFIIRIKDDTDKRRFLYQIKK